MNKKKLIQYCDLKKEIENLKKRIDKIEKQSEMVADVVQNGYKGKAYIYGYDYKRTYKLDLLKSILKERYDKLLDMQISIESYISTIEKSDIRQIFEYRYIDGMNWYQIQCIMEYKHEDTARKRHDKFIDENL
jgi:hypothetical protein